MTAWRDVEVAAAEALDGRTHRERARGHPRRDASPSRRSRSASGSRTTTWPPSSTCSAASAGPAGRWIHYGLTSSDVLDTALALQLRRAGELVVPGARRLAVALAERAREHADTLCVGRTHGVHAEPTSFGLKLAGFAFEAHRNAEPARARVRAGRHRRDLRRRRHLRVARPGLRAARARRARARRRARLHAGRAARPARRARAGDRPRRRRARALRHGGAPPAAHGGARGGGAVPRRAEGLERDAAQAQPDRHRADHGPGPRCCAATPRRRWRTSRCGTSATSRTRAPSGCCCPTRRSCSTTPSTSRCAWSRG